MRWEKLHKNPYLSPRERKDYGSCGSKTDENFACRSKIVLQTIVLWMISLSEYDQSIPHSLLPLWAQELDDPGRFAKIIAILGRPVYFGHNSLRSSTFYNLKVDSCS